MFETAIVKLSQARKHAKWEIIKACIDAYDLPGLLDKMNHAHKQSGRGGACRCVFAVGKDTYFFGFSDQDEKEHAEEHCFVQMINAGIQISRDSIWLMYVDLEPCNGGRYKGHNCAGYFSLPHVKDLNSAAIGRFGIRDTGGSLYYPFFANGFVLYAFDQTDPGEKSLASFMHDKEDAKARLLSAIGDNLADYNMAKFGIPYFALGKNDSME